MIRGLGPEFDLAQAPAGAVGSFPDGPGEKLWIHEVGAGACGQIAAVLYQLHTPQVDLPVSLDSVFHGAAGLGECRRIQYDQIIALSPGLQLWQQVKDIGTDKLHPVGQPVEGSILPGLGDPQL